MDKLGDKFISAVAKLDQEVGKDSKIREDTLCSQALVMTRGKELRYRFRRYATCDKHEALCDYLLEMFPNADLNIISFTLFREGFLSKRLLETFIFLFKCLFFTTGFVFIVRADISNNGLLDEIIGTAIISLVYLGITLILSHILSFFLMKRTTTFYFGLGHRRDE